MKIVCYVVLHCAVRALALSVPSNEASANAFSVWKCPIRVHGAAKEAAPCVYATSQMQMQISFGD